jgi:hypothetical protein
MSNMIETLSGSIDILLLVYKCKFQERHWHQLFIESLIQCNPNFTIKDFVDSGILTKTEHICSLSEIPSKEDVVEEEFFHIQSKLESTHVSFAQVKSQCPYQINPIDSLLFDIERSLGDISLIENNQYSSGIKEQIHNLKIKLMKSYSLLQSWWNFQVNWLIILSILKFEFIIQNISLFSSYYEQINAQYSDFGKYALKNSKIFEINNFPHAIEDFNRCNFMAEDILILIHKFLKTQRSGWHRLFFLSDDDFLVLKSANDLKIFDSIYTKL